MALPAVFIIAFSLAVGYGINCDYKVKMKELKLIEKVIIKKYSKSRLEDTQLQ